MPEPECRIGLSRLKRTEINTVSNYPLKSFPHFCPCSSCCQEGTVLLCPFSLDSHVFLVSYPLCTFSPLSATPLSASSLHLPKLKHILRSAWTPAESDAVCGSEQSGNRPWQYCSSDPCFEWELSFPTECFPQNTYPRDKKILDKLLSILVSGYRVRQNSIGKSAKLWEHFENDRRTILLLL